MSEVERRARLLRVIVKIQFELAEIGVSQPPTMQNFFPRTAAGGIPRYDAGMTVREDLFRMTKMDPQNGFPFDSGDLPVDYISALTTPKGEYSWSAVS